MRYIIKTKQELVSGETKVINKFLWLPLKIGSEIRWLSKESIEYMVMYCFNQYDRFYAWKPHKWVD